MHSCQLGAGDELLKLRDFRTVTVRETHAELDTQRLCSFLKAGWRVHQRFTFNGASTVILSRWRFYRIPFVGPAVQTVGPPKGRAVLKEGATI